MKSWSRVGVILIGLALFGYAEVWGADWKLYSSSDNGTFYYDAESIIRPSRDVVRVWEKMFYSEKGVIDVVRKMGDKFKTLNYSVNLMEFHCAENKMRLLSSIDYSTDGGSLNIADYQDSEWNVLPPWGVGEELLKVICKQPQ